MASSNDTVYDAPSKAVADQSEEKDLCAICLEDSDENMATLNCGCRKPYHPRCIKYYYMQLRPFNRLCPCCKQTASAIQYVDAEGQKVRLELKDAWEIWFTDKYECQFRLIKRFNGFIKYCKASKADRLQEMIDSPEALRKSIDCDAEMGIPEEIEDRIKRYEVAGYELIEKTTKIFSEDDFHPVLSYDDQRKFANELEELSKLRKKCFRSAFCGEF